MDNWNDFGEIGDDSQPQPKSSNRHNQPSTSADYDFQLTQFPASENAPESKTYHVKLKYSDPKLPGKMIKLAKNEFATFRKNLAGRFSLDEKRSLLSIL